MSGSTAHCLQERACALPSRRRQRLQRAQLWIAQEFDLLVNGLVGVVNALLEERHDQHLRHKEPIFKS